MRKQKKLALSKETVRALEATAANLVAGAWTERARCFSFVLKCFNVTEGCAYTYEAGCSEGPDC